MKKINRLAHVPVRTPYQDYVATQRRKMWAGRLGMFTVGLVVLAAACGYTPG